MIKGDTHEHLQMGSYFLCANFYIRWLRAFLHSRWFSGIIQWLTLFIFMLIMFELLLGPTAAHDNFGTAMTWVLWWPLIPNIFLFLGRFWCKSLSATSARRPAF